VRLIMILIWKLRIVIESAVGAGLVCSHKLFDFIMKSYYCHVKNNKGGSKNCHSERKEAK